MPSYKPVNAVIRALDVLAAVSRLGQTSVSQLTRETGLSASTVVRILETLEAAGYVVKDTGRATYVLTGKTLELSRGFAGYREIGVIAGPVMRALGTEVLWPSDVAVFDIDAMVVAETSRSEGRIFQNRRPGFRAPVLGTSLGLAFLAFCSPVDHEKAVEVATRLADPWNDLARDRPRLDRLLDEVRRRGFAIMTEAYSAVAYNGAVWAMGVPIIVDGVAVASVNFTFIRSSITIDKAVAEFLQPLQAAASRIAQAVLISRRMDQDVTQEPVVA